MAVADGIGGHFHGYGLLFTLTNKLNINGSGHFATRSSTAGIFQILNARFASFAGIS
ncbi:hypothetical protein FE845_16340 [Marinobacter sp. 1-4A]|uniref:hypothetical protein n=1 Tax=unclassified Marinobacter TaxID=83889 RepID=UPI001905EE2D|nr:hypothetical protein [Marinobacter sp. 1-4A]MBK1852918.1 hypothetical protein [Marinobacter sp. 1-4A]